MPGMWGFAEAAINGVADTPFERLKTSLAKYVSSLSTIRSAKLEVEDDSKSMLETRTLRFSTSG